MKLVLALLALCASASAFQAPAPFSRITARRGGVSMAAEKSAGDRVAAAALAALLATSPVLPLVASPQQAVAARSGGRAGGRGGGGGGGSFRSAAPRAAAPARSTTINNYGGGRPMGGGGVIVAPVISPFGMGYSPFGYNPMGGLGTGYALGAMSNNGQRQENYRVENQLGAEEAKMQQLQKELEDSKAMNAKLEQRMDSLESTKTN